MVGTMIEIPRAALTADQVAKEAEFFSFGTNDLTQTTMGLSRDDYTKFQKDYEKDLKIFKADPFAVLDQEGVGKLVEMAVKLGRKRGPISKSASAASTAASRVRCSSATRSAWITFRARRIACRSHVWRRRRRLRAAAAISRRPCARPS
jgi:phosphoenolpyruvate synthase/pyruvate phosphate dikinase